MQKENTNTQQKEDGARAELKFIYANIFDLLKFAEAKHARLIVFNIGVLVAALTNRTFVLETVVVKYIYTLCIVCLGFALILGLITHAHWAIEEIHRIVKHECKIVICQRKSKKKPIVSPNLYCWKSLFRLNIEDFIYEYRKLDSEFTPSEFDKQIIHQILANAKITNAKLVTYNFLTYPTIIGAGLLGFFYLKGLL